MSWWSKASEAQKLAQIDGGIECGLSAREVAIASGLRGDQHGAVNYVARSNGRHFSSGDKNNRASIRRRGDVGRARRAFLSGDRVDLWGNAGPQDDPFLSMQEGA